MSLLQQLVDETTTTSKLATPEDKPPDKIETGDGNYVDVVPYNAYNHADSRQFLFYMFEKLLADGLIHLYFPIEPEKSYPAFVRMLSSESTRILLVVVKEPVKHEVVDVMGFASWEPMQFGPSTLGHAGFIFLKAYWDRHTSLAAGKKIEEYWFEQMEPKLDIAVGLIAADNVMANRFVQRLGWTKAGVLPNCQHWDGKPSDAILWRLTREDFDRSR